MTSKLNCFLFLALKIHCSAECKSLLDRLGGYTVIKRGVIGMKGKGEVLTYWLVGEESHHRARRSEERAKRREQLLRKDASSRKSKSCKIENCHNGGLGTANSIGHQSVPAPRSSLKNKNSLSCPRNVVARCVSLESPKKLRFANGCMLDCNPYHKCSHDPIIDVIFNDMPSVKRRPSKVVEQMDEFAESAMSVSCPCIENITMSNMVKEKIPIKLCFDESEYDNNCSNSEPLLLTSSIPCISITSERDMQTTATKHTSDINIPLLQNYCSSAT